MAYEGELVKLANGRWARFQRCQVSEGGYPSTLLVAVELDGHYQRLLEEALETYKARGRMSLDADESGKLSVQVSEAPAVH